MEHFAKQEVRPRKLSSMNNSKNTSMSGGNKEPKRRMS